MNSLKKLWPHILAATIVIIWGITFVNTKCLILAGLSVTEIFVLRFAIAYILISLWTLIFRQFRLWSANLKDELFFVLLGISGGSLYFTTENMAVGRTMVNNVSFIVCTAPLITIFLARIFTHSVSITKRLIVGSLVALAGVAIVVFGKQTDELQFNLIGDLLALAAAICWAVYSLLIKRVSGRYSSLFITRKVFFYGVVTALPLFVGPTNWNVTIEQLLRPDVLANLLFLSTIASFACFLLWSYVIGKIGALKTSNYVYLNPVSTVVASAIVLNEHLTMYNGIGSLLILLGVMWANSKRIEA